MSWNRAEFEERRIRAAEHMTENRQLKESSLAFLKESYREDYCYQWDWLGFPILQMPEDMIIYQEALYRNKPTVVIETGVAWGGSVALAASVLDCLHGQRKVIGVDLNLDPSLEPRLRQLGLSSEIYLFGGSSTDHLLFEKVRTHLTTEDKVMVVLDSHHTHEHVLAELRLYSQLVTPGQLLVVGDTSIKDLAKETERKRPWDESLNPFSAVQEFLSESTDFNVDEVIERKLLTTFHPGGYLVRH